jgi:putative ABC transport system permease protein
MLYHIKYAIRSLLKYWRMHDMRLVAIGLIVGLIAAAGVTHLMASMLYQVEPMDPLVLASMTTLFAVVALIACLVPSLRASRVDPVIALRSQ